MLKKTGASVLMLLWLAGCGGNLPTFTGIDLSKWKEDKNGCLGNRALSINDLDNQKDKLKSLSETEIIKLLGRPDRNELYKRNQKFYYYLLQPGVVCGVDNNSPKTLSIRFNAVGLAKEVMII